MQYKPRRKRNVYTSPSDKLRAVTRVLIEQIPTRVVAEELSVSYTSIQQWVKQYKEYGPEFFTPKEETISSNIPLNDEMKRLKAIEKAYEEQQLEIEILKKFQAFLINE